MIHWFDNLIDRNDNHNVNGGEMLVCFVISTIVINSIQLGEIFTWESFIKSFFGIILLVITLGVKDIYNEYLKPKLIKLLKAINGRQKRNNTKKRAA